MFSNYFLIVRARNLSSKLPFSDVFRGRFSASPKLQESRIFS